MLGGLSQINVELSSKCDKRCYFCGHQNEKVNVGLRYGDMDLTLLAHIAGQVPRGTIIQAHRDGEPLVYPHLAEALDLFSHCIRSIVPWTSLNGKPIGDGRPGAITKRLTQAWIDSVGCAFVQQAERWEGEEMP